MGISVIFTTIDFHLWAFQLFHHHRFSSMGISVISPPWIGIYAHFYCITTVGLHLWAFQFSVQSQLFGLASRAIIFLNLAFRVVLSFRVTAPDVHIHWHCILPSWLCTCPRFSSLHYPVLIAYSSRIPHRAVSFRCILVRTPGWFDRYSSLTSIFESLLETSWREPGSLV